jgi:hypothetical protein
MQVKKTQQLRRNKSMEIGGGLILFGSLVPTAASLHTRRIVDVGFEISQPTRFRFTCWTPLRLSLPAFTPDGDVIDATRLG